MNISISSIAWDVEFDQDIAKTLNAYGVNYVDLTPSRYCEDIFKVTDANLAKIKSWWNSQKIYVYGMQSLLYTAGKVNLFNLDQQKSILEYLDRVCYISQGLGAKKLTFGSPKNRDKLSLSNIEAIDIATTFFYKLGDIAKKYDVVVCLEPNPKIYGSNFMINHDEAALIVKQVSHDFIGLQLDTGAIFINKEDITKITKDHSDIIKHIHLSEPMLASINIHNLDHKKVSHQIRADFPNSVITIEMLKSGQDDQLNVIRKSLEFAINTYK